MAPLEHVRVTLLAHEREVGRAASSRAAQAKRRLNLLHGVGAAVVVVAQLLARCDVALGVEVDAVLAVDRLEGNLHVGITAVRQPGGVVVVVHGVDEENRKSFSVAGGPLQLHVVKLGRSALAHAADALHRLDRVLLRLPRPRRVHLAQEIHHEVPGFHPRFAHRMAHNSEAFAMRGEHLRREPRLGREAPQRLGDRGVVRRETSLGCFREVLRGERDVLSGGELGRHRSVRGVDLYTKHVVSQFYLPVRKYVNSPK